MARSSKIPVPTRVALRQGLAAMARFQCPAPRYYPCRDDAVEGPMVYFRGLGWRPCPRACQERCEPWMLWGLTVDPPSPKTPYRLARRWGTAVYRAVLFLAVSAAMLLSGLAVGSAVRRGISAAAIGEWFARFGF